jgi:hypothetical protein
MRHKKITHAQPNNEKKQKISPWKKKLTMEKSPMVKVEFLFMI